MGRRRSAGLEERRAVVLEAAVEAFAPSGLHGASMDAISALSGTAKPQIYELFASKQELFEAAVAFELEHLAAHLLNAFALDDRRPLRERTRARLEAVFAYGTQRPAGLRLLAAAQRRPSSAIADEVERTRAAVVMRVTDLIQADLARERPPAGPVAEVLAGALVELTMGTALRNFETDGWDDELVIDVLTALLVDGLSGFDPSGILTSTKFDGGSGGSA